MKYFKNSNIPHNFSRASKEDKISFAKSGAEARAKKTRGRTYEEIYGPERASEIRAKQKSSNIKTSKNKVVGKTYEEIFGIDKAKKIRNKMSNSSKKSNKLLRGKTYDEFYGLDKSKRIRKVISEKTSINQANGSLFLISKRGVYKNLRYDSSYELKFIQLIENLGYLNSIKRCPFRLDYEYNRKNKKYNPDFLVTLPYIRIIVEVKNTSEILHYGKDIVTIKMRILKSFCYHNSYIPCLFTNNLFNTQYGNHEPSSVNSFISRMNNDFSSYLTGTFVAEKVQRLEIEEKDTNKISLAPDTHVNG